MNTDKNGQADEQFDGGAATDEEARLIALGTDEEPEISEADKAAADEAAALAATEEATASAAAAAAAAATVPAVPAAPVVPEKPAAPMDFAAERLAVNDKYDNGDLTPVTLQDERERILRAELAYDQQLQAWNAQQEHAVATQTQLAQDDWNRTALAFEAENKDFLSNPLRHEVMQKAIASVETKLQEAGETLTNEAMLARALAIAVDYVGYVKPAAAASTERDALGRALSERKPGQPLQTLGDAPQAHVDTARGNEAFVTLDSLSTPELEIAYANMTPAQQEKFLLDAPGASSNGRGD